jgi:hypothetical protein
MIKALFFIFISMFPLLAYSQQVFNRHYYHLNNNGINEHVRANAIVQTSDGGYFACGTGNNVFLLSAVKLDRLGDTSWTFSADYGINTAEIFYSGIELKSGHLIACGASGDQNLLNSHAILAKFEKDNGDTIWIKKIGLPNRSERFYDVIETEDKGFIACGLRYNVNTSGALTDSDIYLVKTDSLGIPEWERTFGELGSEWGLSMQITSEGGYIIIGATDASGEGYEDFTVIKTDTQGNLLWQNTYGTQYHEYGNSITKLENGEYILAGSSRITSDSAVAVAIRINADGTEIWNRRYPPKVRNIEFTSVKQLSTGEIIVTGSDQGDTLNNTYYGILKSLDLNNGDIIWERQYQYFDEDSTQHYFYAMDTCSDGGLVMGGMVIDFRPDPNNLNPNNAYWVVKTDCAGNEYAWDNDACPKFVGLDEIEKDALFNLYPNPSTGTVTLDYVIPQNAENQSISFYDATGKLVQKVDFTGEGQIQLNIDCSGFSNGVYQCVLVSDGEVLQQGKLVVIQ